MIAAGSAGGPLSSPLLCPTAEHEGYEPMADQPLDDQPSDRMLGAGRTEAVHLPPAAAPRNHGRTVAAWTTTLIVVVGAVVAGLGVALAEPWLAWVGGGVVLAGLIVGKVLQVMGLGQPGSARARGGH